MDNTKLALEICQGLRPNIDEIPMPQLLKDLVKKYLEDKLKEEGISKEKVQIIINYCERFSKSEQELEQEKLQAQIETPPKVTTSSIHFIMQQQQPQIEIPPKNNN
ncbi:2897_t:CDS:2, partial [Racocetra persica]